MKLGPTAIRTVFLLVTLSLAACSRNPNKYLASGDKYFKDRKYNEAIIQYRNAVQIDPKLAQAHYDLARAYLQLKFVQPAYIELQETVALDPRNSGAQLQLATLLVAGKKYAEAKAAAANVLAADPNNAAAHAILGDQSALTGDWAGAIKEFQAAIKLEPRQGQNYSALAAVYTSRGEFSAAEAVFKQAIEANPQSVQALLDLGNFYFSQRKFDEVETAMRSASKLAPKDPRPRLLLADSYTARKNFTDAEKVCAELKTIAPDDPGAYRALALFYLSTGQRAKAAAELQGLRTSKPKELWVRASLAETLLDLGRVQDASSPTQELLAADPNDPRALLLSGRILIAEHKYPEARTALEHATSGAPQSSTAYYFLGVAQKFLGLSQAAKVSFAQANKLSPRAIAPQAALAELDANGGAYEKAERLAETIPHLPIAEVLGARAELAKGNLGKAGQLVQSALERDPVSLPALEVLVKLYANDGRTQEAVRRLSALVSQYPQNAGLRFLLAVSYFNLKDFSKAEESVRQAISFDAHIPDAHALLAEIDNAKGLTAEAENEFKAEMQANPSKASNYTALAHLYETAGKWEDAKSVLEKALAVDPSSPSVKNNLAYLYLDHGGNPHTALSLAREAKQTLPESPVVTDTLGWAFYKIGSYELAIAQLSSCVRKAPGNPEYQYHLGMSYLAAGRFEPAVRSLQAALSGDSNFAYAGSAKSALDSISKRSRR